jgi:hypothetical protein
MKSEIWVYFKSTLTSEANMRGSHQNKEQTRKTNLQIILDHLILKAARPQFPKSNPSMRSTTSATVSTS